MRCQGDALVVSLTSDQVVICQASGLHEGVNNSGANEPKASPNHVFAYGF